MTVKKKTALATVKERPLLLPIPTDLEGKFATKFVDICEMVEAQAGCTTIDGDMIAGVVRSLRRAEIFDKMSAEKLADGDIDGSLKLAGACERAAAAARTAMTMLRITPKERSGKAMRQIEGVGAASRDAKWADLLGDDQ